MADSFQNEVPKARINLKLDLHTGGASKKMELPLKLLVAGDFSNGQESAQISEREKVNITKNNFDSVLSEYSPKLNLTVKNTLSDDGGEENVQLTFQSMKDFTPEQVAAQISELKSVVFSTIQSFNQTIPAEEQLRRLSQHPAGDALPEAEKTQLELRLKQLATRYAQIKQDSSAQ
ncbi:type VI secretion system contractile sheath small subunit [Enterobacter asburiae]|uniref:type VI secretion system contractile sheath small subunit n=1 Tax=Enterobacter asburiae TaxID=61645 RepID=UPI00092F0EF5|nr:type VI secretion system contractile sheath small subunit [Enterobacter asburiae]MBT2098482.1 type VI secretion system contractile sheath small subunit [Enterobacter asburiae]